MINHTHTRIEQSQAFPLHSDYLSQTGVSSIVEGMTFIQSLEDGIGRVRPGTGTAADGSFVGLSAEINRRQTTATAVEQVKVPATAPYTVDLAHAPVNAASVTLVRFLTDGSQQDLAVAASGTESATLALVSGRTVTWHSTDNDEDWTVVYRYSPTLEESAALFGDGNVQGQVSPGEAADIMTVITRGVIFTDQFNTGDNWFTPNITDIHMLANGQLGRTGGAAVEGGAARIQVVHSPTVDTPFLGLYLS